WVLALGLLATSLASVSSGVPTSGYLGSLPWSDWRFSGAFFCPFIAVALFGVYAAVKVTGQAMRFEDKKEAAAELAKDLIHARADLHRRGYVFDN
ncbi:dolichol-phosphate mannosyltransferase subunit 3, partial [Cystoisospora suis]